MRIWSTASPDAGTALAHPAAVRGVSLSADGTRLATAADDGLLRVWDLATGRMLQALAGHQGPVLCVALAPDGKTLASGGADRTVRPWSVSATRVVVADAAKVNALAMLPGGTQWVTGGDDGSVKLWDAAGTTVRQFSGAGGPVLALDASPDGQLVAAAAAPQSGSKSVLVWKTADAGLMHQIDTSATVNRVAFSPDGGRLLVAGTDGRLRLYRPADGLLLDEIVLAAPAVDAVFGPDGRTIVAAVGSTPVVARSALVRLVTGHVGAVTALAYAPDGKRLFSAGADKTVRVWDTAEGKPAGTLAGSTEAVAALGASADGRWLGAGGADKTLRLWKLGPGGPAGEQPAVAIAHPAAIRSVSFSPGGDWVATGADDNTVHVWDTATGQQLQRMAGHEGAVLAVAIDPAGATVVSGSADRTARRWGRSVRRAVPAHAGPIRALALSPDGKCIYTVGGEGKTLVQSGIADLKPRQRYEADGPVAAVALDPGGQLLAGAGPGQVRVWETGSARLVAALPTAEPVACVALADGGTRLITAGADKVVRHYVLKLGGPKDDSQTSEVSKTSEVWAARAKSGSRSPGAGKGDPQTRWELLYEALGHGEPVTGMALGADGRTLLTVGADKAVKRWLAASEAARAEWAAHRGPVYAVRFSPDGTRLATAGGDRSACVWDAEGKRVLALAGHAGQVLDVAYRPDGTGLATCGTDRAIRLFDAEGKLLKTLTQGLRGDPYTLAFAPDGKTLAAGGTAGQWHVWSPTEDKPQRTAGAHGAVVYRVAFNPAGSRLATLDLFGGLRVWGTDGSLVHHQQLPATAAYAMAYSPDGKQLAVGTRDPRLLIIAVPSGAQ